MSKIKKIILAIGLLTVCVAALALYLFLTAPDKIETNIKRTFTQNGFPETQFPMSQRHMGRLAFKDVKLDEGKFSTIELIEIRYHPLSILLGGKVNKILIDGMKLTGEIDEKGRVTIAGWNETLPAFKKLKIKAGTIEFKNASLSLLSNEVGGISINGDILLSPSKTKSTFQANLKTAQTRLNFDSKINGAVNSKDKWGATIDIPKGKVTLDKIRASRISGKISMEGTSWDDGQIMGELQAGGLNILDLPGQNASVTIQGAIKAPTMLIAVKSAGFDGLEMNLNFKNIFTPQIYNGEFNATKLSYAFDYLKSQDTLPIPREKLNALNDTENINIKFANNEKMIFNITNEQKTLNINGYLNTKDDQYKGSFSSNPFGHNKILKKQRAAKNQTNIQGAFAGTIKDGKLQPTLKGKLETNLTGKKAPYGLIPIQFDDAIIKIGELSSLSGPVNNGLNCKVNILNFPVQCTISAQFINGKTALSNLGLKADGLNINIPDSQKTKTTINIQEIDLAKLTEFLSNSQWEGTGKLNGTLTISRNENNQITLDTLSLKSTKSGMLALRAPNLFQMMNMKDIEKETMKLAMNNFEYEYIEIKASGAFPKTVKITLSGRGNNPDLMEGRPFTADFEINPDLTALIAKILK